MAVTEHQSTAENASCTCLYFENDEGLVPSSKSVFPSQDQQQNICASPPADILQKIPFEEHA